MPCPTRQWKCWIKEPKKECRKAIRRASKQELSDSLKSLKEESFALVLDKSESLTIVHP